MSKLMLVADAFVLRSERVAELFPQYDKDNNGSLTYDELIPMLRVLLQEVAPTARMSSGDVLYLIGKCDLDADNALSQDELLPAVVLWAQMAKLRAEKKAKKEAALAVRCHPLEGAKILKKGL